MDSTRGTSEPPTYVPTIQADILAFPRRHSGISSPQVSPFRHEDSFSGEWPRCFC